MLVCTMHCFSLTIFPSHRRIADDESIPVSSPKVLVPVGYGGVNVEIGCWRLFG